MKWFDIPENLVSKLRKLQKKDFHYPIVESEDAFDCENCNKSGWLPLIETLGLFVCENCGGLGWLVRVE
jgi:hypothetical protein